MRILYDHQIFSQQRYGGVSRYFHELIRSIPTLEGDKVEVFAPLHVNEYGAELHGLRMPSFRGGGFVRRIGNSLLARVFVKPRRDVDIFHETYYSRADLAPASAKRVVTVYDMIHERFPEHFTKDRTQEFKRHAVHRADHVICISESTQRDLVELLHVPIEKTSVVHLGFLLSREVKPTDQIPDFRKPYLLYVGMRRGYKNFESLLRVYARSNILGREFALACFGGGGTTVREQELIESLGISPSNIFFLGGDDGMLSKLYASAAAFIYPSLYEGFGIPPLEAMSHGCPVICTNTSSLPEVVGDAAELFDPDSLNEMQAAIERVISSSSRSEILVSRGHLRTKLFSWEKCARETLNEYKRVLD